MNVKTSIFVKHVIRKNQNIVKFCLYNSKLHLKSQLYLKFFVQNNIGLSKFYYCLLYLQ